MEIKDKRMGGNTEFFTVVLDNGVEIKGCKVATGKNGPFIAGPSSKGKDDKWYPHVFIPGKVGDAILALLNDDEEAPF
jgi:DNA-binding cell septation regulator SpoVG